MEEKKFQLCKQQKREKKTVMSSIKNIFMCNFSATKGHKRLKQEDNITLARRSVLQKSII